MSNSAKSSNCIKILSFDIGTDNLAYTNTSIEIFQNKIDYNNSIISEFNLINLINPKGFKECDMILKSGKNKGKKCSNKIFENHNQCKLHVINKDKNAMNKDKNANIDAKKTTNIKKKKRKNNKKLVKYDLCKNLIDELNKNNDLCNVDIILIEEQVKPNYTMIEISHYLYAYILQRLIHEGKLTTKLEYLTAKKRMESICNIFRAECLANGIIFKPNNIKYNRKVNASNLLKYLLENDFNNAKSCLNSVSFAASRKYDDIADCIIQTLWYLLLKKMAILR